MRRFVRLAASGVTLATAVMSGLVIGPMPQPTRAALVAVAMPDSLTMKHDRTAVVAAPGVLGNDLNLGGATAVLTSNVTRGTLSLRSDGGYTYTPASGYVGGDTFMYRPSGLLTIPTTVTITITNATPVAKADAYSFVGSTLVVAAPGVLANDTDADGDSLMAERVGGITGSLDLDPDGGFQYTPGGGFSGSATFSYRVWDGVAWSGTTTVTLTRAAATPTPVPTPSPTPTPAPTATPAPIPSIPLPIPSLPIPSLPSASLSVPSPIASPTPSIPLPIGVTPSPTASPTGSTDAFEPSQPPSDTASPGADGGGAGSTTPGAGNQPPVAGGGAPQPGVQLVTPLLDVGVGTIGILAGLEIWAVPAAVMGGPGLLVLLWIALQAAGASAWVPAARRLRDDESKSGRGSARA